MACEAPCDLGWVMWRLYLFSGSLMAVGSPDYVNAGRFDPSCSNKDGHGLEESLYSKATCRRRASPETGRAARAAHDKLSTAQLYSSGQPR